MSEVVPRERAFRPLIACFFLSGLAALVYQTAWTRELAFVFGTSELAVATVLAAYMAGLAVGAALAGRLAPRIERPVWVYGWLELGIAVAALAVPLGMDAATTLLVHFFGGQAGLPNASDGGLGFFYACVAFALLMIPTMLMGATLPLLARHAVETDEQIGDRIGQLYAWNTAGAVVGTLFTAFVALPAVGLGVTVWIAVAVNAAVFAIAIWIARAVPALPTVQRGEETVSSGAGRWILPAIALSGVVSFTAEVFWTRLLSHWLGGSVYAFATMLSSVLLGIAIGATLAARHADTVARATRAFAVSQFGAAMFTTVAFLAVDRIPQWVPMLANPQAALAQGAGISIAVLLPAALCFGATFPLAVRILAEGASDAARASSRVYAWNTAGAIVGSLGAAHYILPALGFEGTVKCAVAVSTMLGAIALFKASARPASVAAFAVASIVLVLPWPAPERLLRQGPSRGLAAEGTLREIRIGRGASVVVSDVAGMIELRTNGLPESRIETRSSTPGGQITARWMGALPSVLRPGIDDVAVVGFGGGGSIEYVPNEVRRIDVIELEPEVIAANRAIGPERRTDPLADSRVIVTVNDARSALMLTGERYGGIVAQASHPWTSGASHLYTREFFELIASRLEDEGIFVQWMGAAFVDEPLLRTIVATMADVWPHVRVYRPYAPSFLFVASAEPFAEGETVARLRAADPDTATAVSLVSQHDLEAALYLHESDVAEFIDGAEISTDDRNVLQMRSPFVKGGAGSLAQSGPPKSPTPPPSAIEHIHALAVRGQLEDASQRLNANADGAQPIRPVVSAMAAIASGRLVLARRFVADALRAMPEEAIVRAMSLELSVLDRGRPDAELPQPLSATERAVQEAIEARAMAGPEALRSREPGLAAVPWEDPVHRAALALRLDARQAGSEQDARSALALIDEALPFYRADRRLLLRRALVANRLGENATAMASLESLSRAVGTRGATPAELGGAQRIAVRLERDPDLEVRAERIRRWVAAAKQSSRAS